MFNIKNSQGKILKLFFQDPEKEYYLNEIGKILGKEPGFFQASIEKLVQEGILKDERKANLRYFKLNKDFFLYDELKKIISKTVGIEFELKKMIEYLTGVEYAFVFGSIAKDKEISESDIDIVLIGRINQDELVKKINKAEDELKREINYHIYDKEEFIKKLQDNNDFLVKIFNEPKIILKGNLDELTKSN